MDDMDKRLFVGIKISPKLQRELDNCPRRAEHYFKENRPESLDPRGGKAYRKVLTRRVSR